MQDPILGPYSDPAAGLRSKPHRHKQGADIEEPPMMQGGGKTATNLGERASQLSLTFGVLSLINILVLGSWFFGIPTVILSVLGLQKAKEADSYGVVSSCGSNPELDSYRCACPWVRTDCVGVVQCRIGFCEAPG